MLNKVCLVFILRELFLLLWHRQLLVSIMVSHFDYKHRCIEETNVPMVLILPSR